MHQEPELIDQAKLHETLGKTRSAVRQEVSAGLGLQPGNFVGEVAREDGRMDPGILHLL